MHPYRWLQPDLVLPASLLSCDPGITPGESGVLSDSALIDELFRNAWLLYFCGAGRRVADPFVFDAEVGGWLPTLSKVEFLPLVGQDLFDVVQKKKPTAGSLDGWGWRELKGLPLARFDCPAIILSRVKLDGIWPEGLLDPYIAMIPQVDGDSTPWGQRTLCAKLVVYRLWASVRLGHLTGWCQSWMPDSVLLRPGIPLLWRLWRP